jgi:tetratricopeptide (TPR) repeat protein
MFLKPFYIRILSFSSLLILTTLVATPESWAGKDKNQKRRQVEPGESHNTKRERLTSSTEDSPKPMAMEAEDEEEKKGEKRKASPHDLSVQEPSLKQEKTEKGEEPTYVEVLSPPDLPLEPPLTASVDESEEDFWPYPGLTEEEALSLMDKARDGNTEAQDQLAQFVYTAISRGCIFFGESEKNPLSSVWISKWDNIDERISKDDKYRVLAILALPHEEGLELLTKSKLDPFFMGTLYQNMEEESESAFEFFQESAHQGNVKSALKVVNQFLYDFEGAGGTELIPCVELAKQHRDSLDATYALGILYERADRNDEALSCFEEIIQSNQSRRNSERVCDAFYALSRIWEKKGEFKKAELTLQNALSRLKGYESLTAKKIGKLLEKQQKFDEAIEWYLKYHQKKDPKATHALLKLAITHQKARDDLFKNPETYLYKNALKFGRASTHNSIASMFEEKGNMEVAIPFYIGAFELFRLKDKDSAAAAGKKLRELFFKRNVPPLLSYLERNPHRAIQLADPSDPRTHELLLFAAPLIQPERWADNRELIDAYMDDEGRYGIRKNLLEAARWIIKQRCRIPQHHDLLETIFIPNPNPPEHTVANPSFIVGDTLFTQVSAHFNRIATFLENPEFSLEMKEEICPPSLQPFYISLNSFFNLCGEALRRAEHGSGFLINCIHLSSEATSFYGTENPPFFVRSTFDRYYAYLSVGEENAQLAKQLLYLGSLGQSHHQLPDLSSIAFFECQRQALKSLGNPSLPSIPLQRTSTEEFKTPEITTCGDANHLVTYLHQIYTDFLMRGKGYREGMETIVPFDEMTPFQRAVHQSTLKMEEFLQPEISALKTAHQCLLRLPAELQNAIQVHVNSRNRRFLKEYPWLTDIAHRGRGPLPDPKDNE